MTKLFGTSGIRREVSEFSPYFATNLGCALGNFSKDKTIAIGRDTRTSSDMLASAFISGVLSTGHDVVDLGIVTTPTLGIAANDYGTGVMITASHNPPQWNGFKFWSNDGAYSPEQE
ncbi:MAG: phosphoglucosamine mutase, partial [Candidatus Heimdallarchaeota archaeon]|nr:phosphoglucosamine mutase [Candidatus Heimdallarchaeota archaeon]